MKPLKFRAAVSGRGSARLQPGAVVLLAALALVAATSAAPGSRAASRQSGDVRPLGQLPVGPNYGIESLQSGLQGDANGVSPGGIIVGEVMFTQGSFHAALWRGPTPMDLGTLGGPGSYATAINAAGQAVGQSDVSPVAEGSVAFLWQHGKMHGLATLGGPFSEANGINDLGSVVGGSDTFHLDSQGNPIHHAVLWQHGKPHDLGTLGGEYSEAHAINDDGQVVGEADTSRGERHAFLWEKGHMQDLGTIAGGDSSAAYALNRHGMIVGESDIGSEIHGALWVNGVVSDLGPNSGAFGVSDSGFVVGFDNGTNGQRFGFLLRLQDGGRFNLNALIPSLGSLQHIDIANAINSSGQIAVTGNFAVPPLVFQVALLTPCALDVTNQVQVTMEPVKPTAQPDQFKQKVHLHNVSAQDIAGPISLVTDNLQPPGTEIQGLHGFIRCLPPYSLYVNLAGNLKHGQTRTVTLQFLNSSNQPITWTPRVLAGPGMR